VRFHGLRLGYDFADRERSRKNLDKYRVHGTGPLRSAPMPCLVCKQLAG
jgi:hypothetical protein